MAETIRELLSYRIHRLAGALSRGAALRYRREFGVSLVEWRTIALLGGHAPVISSGLSELLEHAKAGKVRLVAISSPQPLSGELASVPTWRSMGVDIAILHWRGLFGPPGMPAEAVKYWEQTIGKLMKTEAWKKAQERHLWFDAYADSATFRRDLAEENKVYTEILTQLGMAKGAEQK